MVQALIRSDSPRMKPVTIWMPDSTKVGDVFMWLRHPWTVSTLYGTRMSSITEVRHTEFPHRIRQAAVRIDTE